MPINVDQSPVNLSTLDRNPLEVVTDFYYLRTWIASAHQVIEVGQSMECPTQYEQSLEITHEPGYMYEGYLSLW